MEPTRYTRIPEHRKWCASLKFTCSIAKGLVIVQSPPLQLDLESVALTPPIYTPSYVQSTASPPLLKICEEMYYQEQNVAMYLYQQISKSISFIQCIWKESRPFRWP
mgnify:CR=1 FL=1